MAVKATPVKIQPGTKMDRTWSKIHTDYVGPMNGIYYLIVVDSFTSGQKLSNIEDLMCKSTKFSQDLVFQMQLYLITELNLWLKNFKISAKNFHLVM